MRSVLVLLVVLAAGAVPAAAQLTEKQALAQAKVAAKVALAGHKARVGPALDDLEAALDALVAGLQAGQFGTPLLQTFLDSAHAFQLEMTDATEDADLAIADGFTLALIDLGGGAGAALDGKYPADFYSGSGGACDDLQVALRKAVAKTYAKLRKRSDAAVKQARAVDVGLTIELFEPRPRGFNTPNEGSTAGAFQNPVICHLLVGGSSLAADGDGIVLAAGTGSSANGDVSVLLFAEPQLGDPAFVVQTTSVTSIPDLGGEWSLLVDDEGAGLPEGNYIVDTFFSGDLTSTDGRIGVP